MKVISESKVKTHVEQREGAPWYSSPTFSLLGHRQSGPESDLTQDPRGLEKTGLRGVQGLAAALGSNQSATAPLGAQLLPKIMQQLSQSLGFLNTL